MQPYMVVVLFWSFLGILIATAAVALLGVTGVRKVQHLGLITAGVLLEAAGCLFFFWRAYVGQLETVETFLETLPKEVQGTTRLEARDKIQDVVREKRALMSEKELLTHEVNSLVDKVESCIDCGEEEEVCVEWSMPCNPERYYGHVIHVDGRNPYDHKDPHPQLLVVGCKEYCEQHPECQRFDENGASTGNSCQNIQTCEKPEFGAACSGHKATRDEFSSCRGELTCTKKKTVWSSGPVRGESVAIIGADGEIKTSENFERYGLASRFEYFTNEDGIEIPQYILTFSGEPPKRVEITSADGYDVRRTPISRQEYRAICSLGGFGSSTTKCELTVTVH